MDLQIRPAVERSADIIDMASQHEAMTTANLLAAAQEASKPQRVLNEEGVWVTQGQKPDGSWAIPDCNECGEEIPTIRLKLGRARCVECQLAIEIKQKGK